MFTAPLGKTLLASLFGLVLTAGSAAAQTHFTSCPTISDPGTTPDPANNATVVIPSSAVSIQNSPIEAEDEIALFTPDGACKGMGVWQGASTAIPIWGDDSFTELVDGFVSGDTLRYGVWDASAGKEYSSSEVNITYDDSKSFFETKGTYQPGGIYQIDSLYAAAPVLMLASPQLLAPDSGATGVPTTTSLIWARVSDATSYGVEVSTTSDFSVLTDSISGVSDTSWTVSGLSDSTRYYWRVRAVSAEDTSAYSDAFSFMTQAAASGVLVAPADSASGVSTPVTFDWRAVDGAERYNLEVSGEPAFSELVVKEMSLKRTRLENVSLELGTTYYWRVEARGPKGFKKESTTYQFTTSTPAKSMANGQSKAPLPDEVQLRPHYPNPVHRQATFTFALPEQTAVTLTVFDMLGRVVHRVVDRVYAAGYHTLQWSPRSLPSGQYVYQFKAGEDVRMRRLTIVR